MGACACNRSSDETIVRDFWQAIPLREVIPSKYTEHVKELIRKGSIDTESVYEKELVESHLLNKDHKDHSKKLFVGFKRDHPKLYNEFIVALFFLTKRDAREAHGAFIELIKTLNLDILSSGSNNEYEISKQEFVDILSLYVNLVSLYGVEYLKDFARDSLYFEKSLRQIYSVSHQHKFIDRQLENYKGYTIPLSKFFEHEYNNFADDTHVRDGLYETGLKEQGEAEKEEKANTESN